MGMFAWVEIDPQLLPDACKTLTGWQTKDVVEPRCETLRLTADGQLVHVWHEWEWRDDETALFGGYLHSVAEHEDALEYHGDMVFYTHDSRLKWWELKARFTDGKLAWVREVQD